MQVAMVSNIIYKKSKNPPLICVLYTTPTLLNYRACLRIKMAAVMIPHLSAIRLLAKLTFSGFRRKCSGNSTVHVRARMCASSNDDDLPRKIDDDRVFARPCASCTL